MILILPLQSTKLIYFFKNRGQSKKTTVKMRRRNNYMYHWYIILINSMCRSNKGYLFNEILLYYKYLQRGCPIKSEFELVKISTYTYKKQSVWWEGLVN